MSQQRKLRNNLREIFSDFYVHAFLLAIILTLSLHVLYQQNMLNTHVYINPRIQVLNLQVCGWEYSNSDKETSRHAADVINIVGTSSNAV